jgi:hypothetical protein
MRALTVMVLGWSCGVPDGMLLANMDERDWEKGCAEVASEPVTAICEVFGSPVEVTYGYSEAECLAAQWHTLIAEECSATFGDFKECEFAIAADPCVSGPDLPQACGRLAGGYNLD